MAKKEKYNKNEQCHLLPFTRDDVISIQDVQQQAGWEITAFNLPESWEFSQGEGVTVAVIDTGVDLTHADLIDNLLPGKNFINPGLPPKDDCGHGSHVTGIICALNNNLGVVGVAPKTKVIPVKVLDKKGNGNLIHVAEGIRWAANQNIDFITMSLGSPKEMKIIQDAIKFANSKGVVTFCAAGNAGNERQIFYPAAYPEVIGIGAIDENFNLASFSCTGPDLDFLAPGVSILSTVPENWYAVLSGTSQATPFVVGLCCLLLSYKRKNNLDINLKNANDYINLLKRHTIPTNDSNFNSKKFLEGFGIIDPRKLMEWARSN